MTEPVARPYSRNRDRLVTHVTERDIDILLLEDLYASNRFQSFLYGAVTVGTEAPDWHPSAMVEPIQSSAFFGPSELTDPHSGETTEGWGETDLDVLVTIGTERILILIENKIDAPFTPQQPDRYRSRARLALASGNYSCVRTLLVAPSAYLAASRAASVFDARVSYEEIVTFLQDGTTGPPDGEASRRVAFRLEMFHAAIRKRQRGEGPQRVHSGVTAFRASFGERSGQLAPELGSINLNEKGHWEGDKWIEYRSALPSLGPGKKPDIVVKTDRKVVHLQIYGWGRREAELRPLLESLLEGDMTVPKVNGSSMTVSLAIPALDYMGSFEAQVEDAETAIRSANRLLGWFKRNEDVLREMAQA